MPKDECQESSQMTEQEGLKEKRKLPVKRSLKRKGRLPTHGAYSIARMYLAGEIDQRTSEGWHIKHRENAYARTFGFKKLSEVPIVKRDQIRLLIHHQLFLEHYEPSSDLKQAFKEVAWRTNLVYRILHELGLKPGDKPSESLEEYLDTYGEGVEEQ